ncbi:MAG: hypothetical protein JHD23_11595 [Akkermansiaceae bacterium]|nr:hypothetical protein [Akkermansiaceae bacterium]
MSDIIFYYIGHLVSNEVFPALIRKSPSFVTSQHGDFTLFLRGAPLAALD